MTNLMDVSRQEEQVEYAKKQLYKLALEDDDDYYKGSGPDRNLALLCGCRCQGQRKGASISRRSRKGTERKARDFLVTYENGSMGCPCCLLHQRRGPDEAD